MSARVRRGDLIEVAWVDIVMDPVGNPEEAKLARRKTPGRFWEQREDDGIRVLVTTATTDEDGHDQAGYYIYPQSCVVGIRLIERAAKR